MVSRKNIWNTLDELEGKKVGSSYKNLEKERLRQGYSNEAPGSDIIIKHPHGKTTFKDTIIQNNKRYELIDAFPNYGGYTGHKQANNLAKQLRSETRNMGSKQSIIVVAKTNASAVYGQI